MTKTLKKEFEEKFVHKGEDGDDYPENWKWTIQGSYPIEVWAFLEQAISQVREGEREKFLKWLDESEEALNLTQINNGYAVITALKKALKTL